MSLNRRTDPALPQANGMSMNKFASLFLGFAMFLLSVACSFGAELHDGSLSDSNIRYIGRWDLRDPSLAHSYWGGAYLRVGFTGTKISARVEGGNEMVAIIDGQPARYVNGTGTVALNESPLQPGNHTLLLGSAGQNPELELKGLELDAGATTLPVPQRKLIEFVGDSITAMPGKGGGNVGNYSWLTAESLNCDHTQIAFSGVALNTGMGFFKGKIGFDQYYFQWQNPNHEKREAWDFSYHPNYVVVNLGTNDVKPDGTRPQPQEFTTSYQKCLEAIRQKLPDATIVAMRPFGGFQAGAIRQAVRNRIAAGDHNVKYIDTTGWLAKDDFSDGIHPNPAGHAKVAGLLSKILFAPPGPIVEELHPSALFQDHMVLQQGMPLRVWGTSNPGDPITVAFVDQSKQTTAGSDGKWTLTLDAMPASSQSRSMTIRTINPTREIAIQDVLVGDVWLCSGQSNMGVSVAESKNAPTEIAASTDPLLRLFRVEQAGSLTPVDDVSGSWQTSSPETVGRWSGVAYYFGKQLRAKTGVPIGLLHSAYGGTPCEAWIARQALDAVPTLKILADQQISEMEKAPDERRSFPAALLAWEKKYGVADTANTGSTNGWANVDCNTSDWKSLPTGFTWATGLKVNTGGVFWVRREVQLPKEAAGKPFRINLGWFPEQYDTTYFNGMEIGSTGHEPPHFYTGPRAYLVPGSLVKAGANVIAIRFVSHTSSGGFFIAAGDMGLPVVDPSSLDNQCQLKAERLFPPLSPQALAERPKLNVAELQLTSSCLYNAMIQPLQDCGIRGTIWYQGENNASRAAEYAQLLPTLIQNWRTQWHNPKLPFYIVQLANFMKPVQNPGPSNWAELREAQLKTFRDVPDTGLAVAIDVGSANTIHPTDKQDVGQRLALWALKNQYDKPVVCTGPLYKSFSITGNEVHIRFDPIGGKLVVGKKSPTEDFQPVPDGKLQQFCIAGDDHKFVWADARIQGDEVVVSSPLVEHPAAVRYAWADNPQGCNLYNNAGLPASPFRTDDWLRSQK
jgi:sialate O-acetylesterase